MNERKTPPQQIRQDCDGILDESMSIFKGLYTFYRCYHLIFTIYSRSMKQRGTDTPFTDKKLF